MTELRAILRPVTKITTMSQPQITIKCDTYVCKMNYSAKAIQKILDNVKPTGRIVVESKNWMRSFPNDTPTSEVLEYIKEKYNS